MQDRFIYTKDDVLDMLDALLEGRGGAWWNEFFEDRSRPCPFFVEWPDENLVAWFDEGLLTPGRVLELGCGSGRNAIYLASLGCSVDAVDFSSQAIEWAQQRAKPAGVSVDSGAVPYLIRRSRTGPTTLSTTVAASTVSLRTAARIMSNWCARH
jgi:SAM-dependent methyltransferase